jgi:pimeloyl-ACP methyl ester carboxylesterase
MRLVRRCLFLNHSSWSGWIERFTSAGHHAQALAWPGLEGSVEELRRDPMPLTKLDIAKVLESLEAAIRPMSTQPIIIGHSFGGLFAQLWAYRGLGSAIVGLGSTAPAGVLSLPFSTIKATAPVLANPLNIGGATMLTPEQFQYAFTNTLTPEASKPLYERFAIPCVNRILFEGAFENFAPHLPARIRSEDDKPPVLARCGRRRPLGDAEL